MDIYNQTTIDKFQETADIFRGWDKDAKVGLYLRKEKEATERILKELPSAAEAWPEIKEAFEDVYLMRDIKCFILAPLRSIPFIILEDIYCTKRISDTNRNYINTLIQDLVTGQMSYIKTYNQLADTLLECIRKINSKITDILRTKLPTKQEKHPESINSIIVNLDNVFGRNGKWRKSFVQLVKDEKRDGIEFADSSFNNFKALLTNKGYSEVADKLKHKGEKMYVDIPYGQIGLVSE